MPAAPIVPTLRGTMFRTSYAVLWRDGDGPVSAGKLVLGPTSLRLETGSGHGPDVLEGDPLRGPHRRRKRRPGRSHPFTTDRGPRPERRERLSIAAVDGMGSGREIVERLTSRLAPRTAA